MRGKEYNVWRKRRKYIFEANAGREKKNEEKGKRDKTPKSKKYY